MGKVRAFTAAAEGWQNQLQFYADVVIDAIAILLEIIQINYFTLCHPHHDMSRRIFERIF